MICASCICATSSGDSNEEEKGRFQPKISRSVLACCAPSRWLLRNWVNGVTLVKR
ncbi:hypothetical protein D9M71_814630 [compost metagenome]